MTVYTIARSMVREKIGTKDPIRTYMTTMFTTLVDQEKEACDWFDKNFKHSDDYAAGWRLTGLHALSEFHQGHIKKWAPYIASVPPAMTAVITDPHPHLQLVKKYRVRRDPTGSRLIVCVTSY